MKKEKPTVQNQIPADEAVETVSEAGKKSKAKRFWEYVTDYKRSTVALTLPSAIFDISYSGFLLAMSIVFFSYWLFMMSFYIFLLFWIRILVLYRAGRGAVFKGKRFSERRNYRKFCWNLIFLDAIIAFNMFVIVKFNVLHNYSGFLIYIFGAYVFYKVTLAVINLFKAHKSKSLTALSLRKIGITDAMVSTLALEWALSHREFGDFSFFLAKFEKYIGIAVVAVIFLMGFGGLITCARLNAKEKKEGKV